MQVRSISTPLITKYLRNKNAYAVKKDANIHGGIGAIYYDKQDNYIGEMSYKPGNRMSKFYKHIFNDKLKPLYDEYISVRRNRQDVILPTGEIKYMPIAIIITRLTVNRKDNTQTEQVIERVLQNRLEITKNKYGDIQYKTDGKPFKFIQSKISEKTEPFVFGKYSKVRNF